MKNTFKKMAALLMAVAMVITSMSFTAFAAKEKDTITVSGVEAGTIVTAYKIVEQDSNSNWKSVTTGKPADPTKPTTKEITDLAVAAASRTDGVVLDGTGTTRTKDLGPGMYLILVTNGTNKHVKVYNPMIVSVDFNSNGDAKGGSVNAGDELDDSKVTVAEGTKVWAKSEEPGLTKEIKRGASETGTNAANSFANGESTHADTASKGDNVKFVINTAIPGYAENYTNPVFKITDNLSAGLKNNKDYVVTVGTKTATKGTDYTVDQEGDSKFVINFKPAFISANIGAKVKVEYSALVKDDCKENFTPETNEAYITYSNAPDEEKDSDKEKTNHYTFTINGQLQATDKEEQRELVKVGIDEDGNIVMEEKTAKTKKEWKNLEGATFNLYKAADCDATGKPNANAKAYRTSTSGADGRLDGLDRLDAGEYYLVEQSVPAPYAKKDTPIKVVISAVIEDDLLKSYEIKVGGVTAASYEATYENGTITNISGADPVDQAADIINTKLGTLPSTGGMGTIIFTIAGIALMAIAAGLLIAKKKASK